MWIVHYSFMLGNINHVAKVAIGNHFVQHISARVCIGARQGSLEVEVVNEGFASSAFVLISSLHSDAGPHRHPDQSKP
jgi:hypothetical protein